MVFGTTKNVLFIEVSSFQGVLIRGVPLYLFVFAKCTYMHICKSIVHIVTVHIGVTICEVVMQKVHTKCLRTPFVFCIEFLLVCL